MELQNHGLQCDSFVAELGYLALMTKHILISCGILLSFCGVSSKGVPHCLTTQELLPLGLCPFLRSSGPDRKRTGSKNATMSCQSLVHRWEKKIMRGCFLFACLFGLFVCACVRHMHTCFFLECAKT